MQRKVLILFGILLLGCILLTEFLVVYKLRTPPSPHHQAPQLSELTAPNMPNIVSIPIGYFLVSTTKTSMLLAAKLMSLTNTKDGIQATLSFALNNGKGQVVQQPTLITLTKYNSPFIFVKQATQNLFATSSQSKRSVILNKDVLDTLKQYIGRTLVFQFPLEQENTTTKNTFFACNLQFALFLQSQQKQPACLPLSQSAQVYESF